MANIFDSIFGSKRSITVTIEDDKTLQGKSSEQPMPKNMGYLLATRDSVGLNTGLNSIEDLFGAKNIKINADFEKIAKAISSDYRGEKDSIMNVDFGRIVPEIKELFLSQ